MPRVLVAEDYPPLAKVISIACQRDGHEVERAGSVARALALPGVFDLAVVNLDLIDGRGTDLALELGRQGRLGRVVFLASASDHELTGVARALGSVIQKESGVEELIACVRAAFAGRRNATESADLAQAVGAGLAESDASSQLGARSGRSGMHKRVR